ncbi:hypothetical protein, partial [Crenobacter intestini]|uniref:hypothetical protein n=1 Tax=Crenobacter intestini TaxID=2563443 RepID=UPI00196A4BF8
AVQVLASPSTHTYRLFVLLKISADFVSFASSAEEANYTFPAGARQAHSTKKSEKNGKSKNEVGKSLFLKIPR